MKKRIGVIFGGNSVEHEISILSMVQASYAIDIDKYDPVYIYMTKDCHFWVGPGFHNLKTFRKDSFRHYEVALYNKNGLCFLKGIRYLPRKYRKPIDAILPIVHGKNVEDGSLAGLLKILNVPYASCGILQASIFQNKYVSKKILLSDGIEVIPFSLITIENYKEDANATVNKCIELGFPLIAKPVSLGSSVGIRTAINEEELINALQYGFRFEDEILVEKKLNHFREFNQAVLETENGYVLSAIEEVKSTNAFLTFDDKYMPSTSSREIPAKISEGLRNEISGYSQKIAEIHRMNGVFRIDYLYDIEKETLFVNEINTIPGSLAFYLFEDRLSFPELIDAMINTAIKNYYHGENKLNSFKSNVLSTTRLLKK